MRIQVIASGDGPIQGERFKLFQELILRAKKKFDPTGEKQKSYSEAGLSDKRFRWDLMYAAFNVKNGLVPDSTLRDKIFTRATLDSHIDTALRKILKSK